jgi:GT2 family glycosyltransferase
LAVIIPAFENPQEVRTCLRSIIEGDFRPGEVVVVDDGSESGAGDIAASCEEYGARYLRMAKNAGPAAARNAGARATTASVLLFLDSDVSVHPGTIGNVAERLAGRPELAAIFGAYDDQPTAPGAASGFRNLLHHYVHLHSAGPASTFWAGCGAIRRNAFESVGGFREVYRRPSIEDVELGQRLHASGFPIELDPSIQVTHGKQWSLGGMFRTDLLQRAVPWTELAWESGGLPRGLNFGWGNRASVLMAGVAMLSIPLAWPLLALAMVVSIALLNWRFYKYVSARLGLGALPAAVLAHFAHFCAAFLGYLLGTLRYFHKRDPAAGRVAAGLLAAALLVQIGSGAYTADFCGYPDESGHFVSSVMLNRFLSNPFQNPMDFASRYYAQYPKVSIGHWPPLGYVLEGAWMRVMGVGRIQALAGVLLCCVMSAFLLYELVRKDAGVAWAAGAALFFVIHPTVRENTAQVMLDVPVVLFVLLAVVLFRSYVEAPGPALALGFGTMCALALLIKANAAVLALLPPAYLLISGEWRMARRLDFWMAAVPPLLLAGPWYLYTTMYFYQNFFGWAGVHRTAGSMLGSVPAVWLEMAGPPMSIAMAAAFAGALVRRGREDVLWAAVLLACGLTAAVLGAMGEPRHQLPALAAMVALISLAARRVPKALALAGAAILVAGSWREVKIPHLGYTATAAVLQNGAPGNVLLAGDGESAVIAAVVASHPDADGQRLWLRANKLMGEVSWGGRIRKASVTNVAEAMAMLDRFAVNQVFLGTEGEAGDFSFRRLLLASLERNREWIAVPTPADGSGAMLYRRHVALPAKPVKFYLPRLRTWMGETN